MPHKEGVTDNYERKLARTAELYEKEYGTPYLPSFLNTENNEEHQDTTRFFNALSFSPADVIQDFDWLPFLRRYVTKYMGIDGNNDGVLLGDAFLEGSLKQYEEFFFTK